MTPVGRVESWAVGVRLSEAVVRQELSPWREEGLVISLGASPSMSQVTLSNHCTCLNLFPHLSWLNHSLPVSLTSVK